MSDFPLSALSTQAALELERFGQSEQEWAALDGADQALVIAGICGGPGGQLGDRDPAEIPRGVAVRVVSDPHDCGRCTQVLTALHHLGAGRVVCHPRPGGARAQLGADLLGALGKRHDALRLEHLGSHGWVLARIWLRAERIVHLVVLRAHQLGARLLGELCELAKQTGLTLWLVWHDARIEPDCEATLALRQWSVTAVDDAVAELSSAPPWGDTRRDGDDGEGWPVVPHADFPVFRAAAYRLLDKAAFARVDAVYRATMRAARTDALCWRVLRLIERPGRGVADRWALAAVLQRHTIDAASSAEVITRVRAVQAAFFREGLLLSLRLDPARHRGAPGVAPRLAPETQRRLRLVCCPTAACALAVAVATGCDAATLAELTIGRVSSDGRQVDLRGGPRHIAEPITGLVRAGLLSGHPDQAEDMAEDIDGLEPAAPRRLLTDERGRRFSPEGMASLVSRAAGLAGIDPPYAALPGRFDVARFIGEVAGVDRVIDLRGAAPGGLS